MITAKRPSDKYLVLPPARARWPTRGRSAIPGKFRSGWGGGHFRAARFYQLKIHLLLEGVHFVNLNDQLIAQLDDAAGASADQMISCLLKNEEILLQRGEMNQSAHA